MANDFDQAKVLYDRGYNLIFMMSDTVDLAKYAARRVQQFQDCYGK
ncbi:MAG: hypothetical protein VB100_07715 [Angelakisella sp.]|nr:hypothetical protein [Angelakisella sp.]